MGQRIDDEIREQELKEQAALAKIFTPRYVRSLAERLDALEQRITKLDNAVWSHPHEEDAEDKHIEMFTPTGFIDMREEREKFENDVKEKISLWLADVNEPIWKQIEKLQERITELEIRVTGNPHDTPIN